MDKQKKIRRDRLQNCLIVLLSLSALYLFMLTQSQLLDWNLLPVTSSFSGGNQEQSSSEASRLQELDWPVTLVVSDAYGDRRYQQLSTGDSTFTAVEGLWEDVFRQTLSPVLISYDTFREALALPGIYTGFPSAIPAGILSARLGLPSEDETPIQRLLLAADGEQALFLFSSATAYYRCSTELAVSELTALAEQLGGEPCLFVFEQEEDGVLHPLTVLPDSLPQYMELNVAATEESLATEELLNFFGFNAHTTNRYTESSGTEVIMESPRRLSVSPDGSIRYLGNTSYAPDGFALTEAPSPALSELVDGAYRLLLQMPGVHAGEERLFLSHVEYNPGASTCLLRFSYMVNGLPLACSDGAAAAELSVTDGIVTEVAFLHRNYTTSDTPSLLLPLRQASAIAANYAGLELALSYVDGGSSLAGTSWIMR